MRNNSGFTTLELFIAVSIFITATFILGAYLIQNYQANRFANEQNNAINHAKKGIDIMVKEIREASPAENGDYPIALADNQEFIFYSDIDTDEETERVRYFLDGTDLKKGVIEPTGDPIEYPSLNEEITILSQYVRNDTDPIFYYYNGDWPGDTENNPLTPPIEVDEVKFLHAYLKININPAIAPKHFELESSVQIRNLKDNL